MDVASETDLQRLRQMALILEAENQTLHRRLRSLSDQVARLEGRDETAQLALELSRLQQTAALQRRALFGRKSERRGRPSADAAGTHVDATESAATERPRQTGHGPREQPELPVVEVFHDLDEPDRMCPQCGEQLVEWPGQFESSEEVDVVVREFRVVTHHRRKYRCSCGGCVETALGPPKLQAGGRYSPRFAVAVAIDKYADHLPLTRQGRRMARQGLQVGSQTLWDQLWALAEHLEPSWRALHARVLQSPVVGADETTWPMLESGSKKWWVWAATAPDAVYYEVQRRRNHEAAGKLLAGFSGVVVADGMGAYRKLQALRANAPPGRDGPAPMFELASCWAHVRRKFFEAEASHPEAAEALDLIGELYRIEAAARAEGGEHAPEHLRRLRDTKSRAVLRDLRLWLSRQRALPKSSLGKAVAYAEKLWPGLQRFLDDPRIPLDNNHTERAMRAPVLGRKNHYGSRSVRGTKVAALFYSLIESARLAGIDPERYLIEATNRAIARPGTATLPSDLAA